MVKHIFCALAALCLAMALGQIVYAGQAPELWQPAKGDFLVVDVSSNTGYLMRQDLSEARMFTVATGAQRNLVFGGKPYFAATPVREWTIRALDYQVKGPTFGSDGIFLRMFYRGQPTHYGVHTVLYEDAVFSGERYKSNGCVLVRSDMLQLLVEIFEHNKEDGVRVITLDDMSMFPLKRVKNLALY